MGSDSQPTSYPDETQSVISVCVSVKSNFFVSEFLTWRVKVKWSDTVSEKMSNVLSPHSRKIIHLKYFHDSHHHILPFQANNCFSFLLCPTTTRGWVEVWKGEACPTIINRWFLETPLIIILPGLIQSWDFVHSKKMTLSHIKNFPSNHYSLIGNVNCWAREKNNWKYNYCISFLVFTF